LFVLEGILHVDIEVFMLIFVRMTGLFVIAPIFGSRNIPTYCKIGVIVPQKGNFEQRKYEDEYLNSLYENA